MRFRRPIRVRSPPHPGSKEGRQRRRVTKQSINQTSRQASKQAGRQTYRKASQSQAAKLQARKTQKLTDARLSLLQLHILPPSSSSQLACITLLWTCLINIHMGARLLLYPRKHVGERFSHSSHPFFFSFFTNENQNVSCSNTDGAGNDKAHGCSSTQRFENDRRDLIHNFISGSSRLCLRAYQSTVISSVVILKEVRLVCNNWRAVVNNPPVS